MPAGSFHMSTSETMDRKQRRCGSHVKGQDEEISSLEKDGNDGASMPLNASADTEVGSNPVMTLSSSATIQNPNVVQPNENKPEEEKDRMESKDPCIRKRFFLFLHFVFVTLGTLLDVPQSTNPSYRQKGDDEIHSAIIHSSVEPSLDQTSACSSNQKDMSKSDCMHTSPSQRMKKIRSTNLSTDPFFFTWILFTIIMLQFSIQLPHWLSIAASKTFHHAWYQYSNSPEKTFFDNTILTYGTDYLIFLFMLYASYQCWNATTSTIQTKSSPTIIQSRSLCQRSAALFTCYAISVFAGGYAHQYYTTLTDLETLSFRILWTICVGSVTFASTFMGMCGSEICTILHSLKVLEKELAMSNGTVPSSLPSSVAVTTATMSDRKTSCNSAQDFQRKVFLPIIPDSYWFFYGIFMTFYCAMGGLSCYRPAADIFLAGVTQFIPTIYCELVLLSFHCHDSSHIDNESSCKERLQADDNTMVDQSSTRISRIPVNKNPITCTNSRNDPLISTFVRSIFYCGFILNAPLLPLYPLLIQYTTLSLGVVNALLHCNLTVSWGMQAYSLFCMCRAFHNYRIYSENGGDRDKLIIVLTKGTVSANKKDH